MSKPAKIKRGIKVGDDSVPATSAVRPQILILASRYDLSCDYVVSALRRSDLGYFRLNSEDLPSYSICLEPCHGRLSCSSSDLRVEIDTDQLTGVYFRRPTFLRETSQAGQQPQDQFHRAQWAAFVRNLMVLDAARWINHPTHTYEAEHKMLQLRIACEEGFDVPETYCLNSRDAIAGRFTSPIVAVKGLDTVLVRTETTESFGYTNLLKTAELEEAELKDAPLVVQQSLMTKLDLRVTVVGDDWWCASATEEGAPIAGDWRLRKTNVAFSEFPLPESVGLRCVALTRRLGLHFAAIDLARSDNHYFFLEVNPTGEWAWLQEQVGFPIASKLVKLLGRA